MIYVEEEIAQDSVNYFCDHCLKVTDFPEVAVTDEEVESDGDTLTATVTYEVTCVHCGEVEERTYRV